VRVLASRESLGHHSTVADESSSRDIQRDSYDRVAERYAAEISSELDGKPLDRSLLAAVAELAGPGPVADIGCGPGHVAAHLGAGGAPVIGLDLSFQMCRVAFQHANVPAAVGDMRMLPLASESVAAIVCLYACIHLDTSERSSAYQEFARVLRPGGPALVAFHVFDEDTSVGDTKTVTRWWDHDVRVTFRFLDPASELDVLARVGLEFVARLDRAPHVGREHPSSRSYLLVRRPTSRTSP